MASQIIETGIVGGDQYTVGQRVCITGRGTANLIHKHGTVKRFTKTMMIVGYVIRRGGADFPCERRYRLGSGFPREVGASEWGGSSVSPRCTRPK